MPRGFAEMYFKQTNAEMFSVIEDILSAGNYYIENSNTNKAQVWNEDGNLLEVSRDELLSHIEKGNSLIVFWNDSGKTISSTVTVSVFSNSVVRWT